MAFASVFTAKVAESAEEWRLAMGFDASLRSWWLAARQVGMAAAGKTRLTEKKSGCTLPSMTGPWMVPRLAGPVGFPERFATQALSRQSLMIPFDIITI